MKLSPDCKNELAWWQTFLTHSNLSKSLHLLVPSETIYCDASGFAYGSTWRGCEIQGMFTPKQKKLSINTKELLAIYYTIGAHCQKLRNKTVYIRCDNTTAITCIRHRGSKNEIRDRLTVKIFQLASSYNIQIVISYIASKQNISDSISRKIKPESINSEWSLHDHDFKTISKLWTHTPDMDLFASYHNCKFPKFVSWKPCLDAMHIDAFTLNWKNIKGFLFPPFPCVASVVRKCIDDEVTMLCGVFPLWPTKTWYPALMCLAGGSVTLLPRQASKRLFLPWDPEKDHPMGQRLRLIFVNLSVKCYNTTICQNPRLITLPNILGVKAQSKRKCPWSDIGRSMLKKKE